MLLRKQITKPIIWQEPPCGFMFLTGLWCRCSLLSILCLQLLHWIWVYCGCVSNINCKTSQSKIYLTAKIVGEAEEDMGVLSFKRWWMDFWWSICFYFWRTGAGLLGQLMEITNLSLYDIASIPVRTIAGLTWTSTMSLLWSACRWRDCGVPYTFF